MKLCIVTHTVAKGDGQGRVNYEVTQAAIRQGHRVILVATSIAPELQQHSQVVWVPITVKPLPSQLLKEMAFSWQAATWLRSHRSDFDLLQVNGAIAHFPADVNAAHFVHHAWLQSPYHLSRQRRDAYGAYQWAYTTVNAYWEKQAFNRANVVIAVSEKLKQDLIAIGVSEDRIQVIANGVDLEEFAPGQVERPSLGLPEAVPLALFVGDIRTNRKNLDTVLLALIKVPELHLAIVGDTEGSPYPELATQLGLAARTHFLGYRHDIPDLMRAADLFVFPSRYEACSLVLLEALASGLPIITANSAGGSEILTSDCGIVLLNSENVDALVQALSYLSNQPEQRIQMGQIARSIAQQYSWSQMGQRYLDLFLRLSQSGGAEVL
ncbi:MAG: glycosyltransferase family 4 protein [Cyanobacteria bacterium CAN_BIN43]|nr:glycosyltransferase family 4 protein [Cyanobacteria bacterium CAN_BIN43]